MSRVPYKVQIDPVDCFCPSFFFPTNQSQGSYWCTLPIFAPEHMHARASSFRWNHKYTSLEIQHYFGLPTDVTALDVEAADVVSVGSLLYKVILPPTLYHFITT